ncbi:MAG: hypothetical protein HYV03_07585 [Deltaproteobacteria bacterium]|nr:hypothetical protein [Deltaproteobacteria bacterium]
MNLDRKWDVRFEIIATETDSAQRVGMGLGLPKVDDPFMVVPFVQKGPHLHGDPIIWGAMLLTDFSIFEFEQPLFD